MKKPRRFTGDLARPIVSNPLAISLKSGSAGLLAEESRVSRERTRRLRLLARDFGIDTGAADWDTALLFRLAEEICPGLRVKQKKGGRPKRSGKIDAAALFADVEALGNLSVSAACQYLAKNKWKGHRPRSLETRYYEHKQQSEAVRRALIKTMGKPRYDELVRDSADEAKARSAATKTKH
jgi:hypothetical protein